MKSKKNLNNIFCILIIIISSIIISLSIIIRTYFSSTNIEQILYNLLNLNSTSNFEYMDIIINKAIVSSLILSLSSLLPIIMQTIFKIDFSINIRKKRIKLFPISFKKYSIFLCIISLVFINCQLPFHIFIYHQIVSSKLYEEYYVPYQKENITFPKQKQNLIMIYVESLENSGFSIENGGLQEISYTPNLEQLSSAYINFSNTEKLGGFKKINGTSWTASGLVAQTSGIPIRIKTKNKQNQFLKGVTSIGDILKENGYNNYISMGSNSNFGDRDLYFKEHGDYTIYDYNYAIESGELPEDYFVWWGYEDERLYSLSKKRLTEIAKKDESFNFSILTADTHFFDGYTSFTCERKFDSNYANSYYCTDKMLAEFIMWIQNQDFYKNTTIVITGDHLTMRDDFYNQPNNYERTVFNLFINSKAKPSKTKNRDYTAMDIYPTTLASLGVNIKDNKLGLGTNLFSNEKTLSEKIGHDKLDKELQKKLQIL